MHFSSFSAYQEQLLNYDFLHYMNQLVFFFNYCAYEQSKGNLTVSQSVDLLNQLNCDFNELANSRSFVDFSLQKFKLAKLKSLPFVASVCFDQFFFNFEAERNLLLSNSLFVQGGGS